MDVVAMVLCLAGAPKHTHTYIRTLGRGAGEGGDACARAVYCLLLPVTRRRVCAPSAPVRGADGRRSPPAPGTGSSCTPW